MGPVVAGATVFLTSGAVLILEILALRLLAPYVGVTIETYTATIATVLAGISLGTWLGGRAADRIEPRRLLGPLLVVGGALALLSVPLVRQFGGGGGGSVVGLSLVGFFAPAAVLSAVTPTVVKLQLRDLGATGRVVGRLSALGTAGAIIGTYLAGFVLVEAVATSTSILAVGGALMVAGVALWLWLGRGGVPAGVVAVARGVLAGTVAVRSAGPCHVETVYHCARVVADEARPGGRLLLLDTLRHSYVDLDDPTHLEFAYARVFADVIATVAPAGPLRALHVGGGGFTLPGYLRAVRPGSLSTVLEIDPGLVRLSRDRLGLVTGPDLDVHVGDARLLLDTVAVGRYDVVLGDAFGGLAVPWHLTTQEFLEAVRARLGAGGVYLMNLIDYPPMRFARSEAATLGLMFDSVAVIAPADVVAGRRGGNVVLVAGAGGLDVAGLASAISSRGGTEVVVSGRELAGFVDG
ncbi:MAG TPA: fused MFS/spermidine synthase, partial [Acidimicrobiales bacterium]|nr:fused MFS/spermidine synthase [Acidimicrobiales bacterium]